MMSRVLRLAVVVLFGAVTLGGLEARAQIRDGGVDPWNLGKGVWIYSMKDATNRLGGHIAAVKDEDSLMSYFKGIGVRHVIVKAATSATLFGDCKPGPQFNTALVNSAHANGGPDLWLQSLLRRGYPGGSGRGRLRFQPGRGWVRLRRGIRVGVGERVDHERPGAGVAALFHGAVQLAEQVSRARAISHHLFPQFISVQGIWLLV